MGRRVERTRAGGTWTESRYFGFIRSLLRRGFTSYPVKYQVKKAASRPIEGKRSLEYQCNVCKGWFSNKEVEVDHIKPAGSLKTYEDLPRLKRDYTQIWKLDTENPSLDNLHYLTRHTG